MQQQQTQILAFDVFRQALDQPEADRLSFARDACNGDPSLLDEVSALLRCHSRAGEFLISPTAGGPAVAAIEELPSAAQPVGARIGRYTLRSLIGEGGFGSVFLARQDHPVRRDVALKLIKLGMDTRQVIARFDAERQALAMMDHPNIARVFDAGATDTGRPYFVMELVSDGVPITRYCDDRKLTIQERLELFSQACHAVQHAHTKGVIHRDLKPSNILITQTDGEPTAKVIDFGIAKAVQGRLVDQTITTAQAQWIGTPLYMSPEQVNGSGDIDTRSDIYMLGVLLYELLTGVTPFGAEELAGKSPPDMQRMIREVEPRSPSTRIKPDGPTTAAIASSRSTDPPHLHRLLRGQLDWVVMKSIEKDPARRYETAAALAADVQRYLRHEPVTARDAGPFYRLRKLIRRNRLAFGSAAAVIAALLAGLITSTWQYVRARDAKASETALREDTDIKAYASDMSVVQQALALNNLGRAREFLDRHRPRPGEKDRRGWEWRYLWQQCRSDASLELPAPGGRPASPITSIAASSDGRWLAVGQADGGLRVWDLPARKEVAAPPAGDRNVQVAFCPGPQPLLVFSSSSAAVSQGTDRFLLHLWNPLTGKQGAQRTLNHECVGLSFSQDGQTLVTSTWGPAGRLTLWQMPQLTEKQGFNAAQFSEARIVGQPFSASSDLNLCTVTPDGSLATVDLSTGKMIRKKDIGVTAVALSPDGRILAVGTGTSLGAAESAITLLNARTGELLGSPLEGHLAWVGALAFWPDGRTLASGSRDRTIRLWDVSDPAHAKPIGRPLRGHTHGVWRLALLPDGKTLASGAEDGTVCLWDTSVPRGEQSHMVIASIFGWDFGPEDDALFTVDSGGHVECRRGQTFRDRRPITDLGDITIGTFGGHGRTVSFHTRDGEIHLRDLKSLHDLKPHPQAKLSSDGRCDMTPEGNWLLHFVSNTTPVEWDPINPFAIASWHPVGGSENKAVEWDQVNNREVDHWPTAGVGGAASVLAWGSWRLVLIADGTGTLFDRATRRRTTFQLNVRGIENAAVSADGKLLATAIGRFGQVGLWKTADLAAGQPTPQGVLLSGFTLSPHCVAFSPDGLRLVAGDGWSEAIKIWDVESHQELLTLGATGSVFGKVLFSADGNVLVASKEEGAPGDLHLWRAPTMEEIDAAEAGTGWAPRPSGSLSFPTSAPAQREEGAARVGP